MSQEPKTDLAVFEVIQAFRQELHQTNEARAPENLAAIESIDLELNVVVRRDPTGEISIKIAEPDSEEQTHAVRVKLKPSRWR